MSNLIQLSELWLSFYSIHLLEISLFIVLVWLTDKFLRLNTRLRYVLWLLALLKIFFPPVITLPSAIEKVLPVPNAVLPLGAIEVGTINIQNHFSLSLLLLCVWVLYASTLVVLILSKNFIIHRGIQTCGPVKRISGPKLGTHTRQWLQVFETEGVRTPVLLGLWQPKLYLPRTWSQWSDREFQGVIAHEIEHLRHRDLWVLGLQFISLVLCGVNPLVWMVHQRLNQLRELRCDEAAIRQTGMKPTEYCKLILKLVENGTGKMMPLFAGKFFAQKRRFVSIRIDHLLSFQEAKMKTKRILSYGIPLTMLLLIFVFSWRCSESNPVSGDEVETASPLAGSDFVAYDSPPTPIGGFQAILKVLHYPDIARKAGIEGRVILQVLVNENGDVEQTKVLKSLGKSGCDEAAIQAIKSVKWKPAQQNSRPVKVWVAIPVVFSLGDHVNEEEIPETVLVEKRPETAELPDELLPKLRTLDRLFQRYDSPPQPIGGLGAIQRNLKYPAIARKAGIEGRVVVLVSISAEGEVQATRVAKSLGAGGCDEAAVNAVKAVRWQPAKLEGKAVSTEMAIPILFKLK